MQYLDIKVFVNLGILQELNRCFLHPMGLALVVKMDDDGDYTLDGIWDARDDPDGIMFSNELQLKQSSADYVSKMVNDKLAARVKLCGASIQPISNDTL